MGITVVITCSKCEYKTSYRSYRVGMGDECFAGDVESKCKAEVEAECPNHVGDGKGGWIWKTNGDDTDWEPT
jgi:hypothetical protein